MIINLDVQTAVEDSACDFGWLGTRDTKNHKETPEFPGTSQ